MKVIVFIKVVVDDRWTTSIKALLERRRVEAYVMIRSIDVNYRHAAWGMIYNS